MNALTPDGREISLSTLLRISADSPRELRVSDVDRVMSAAAAEGVADAMRAFLLPAVTSETAAELEAWVAE